MGMRILEEATRELVTSEAISFEAWSAAVGEIDRGGEALLAAPIRTEDIAAVRALRSRVEARKRELRDVYSCKMLHLASNVLLALIDTLEFRHRSRGDGCGCKVWRDVAAGGGLAARPTFAGSVVIESVDDAYERHRVYACEACGARWLEDANIDSDPSVTRWWAQ
jgi:hypothetical protein